MNVVGIDIGGTFTDLVGCVDGRIVTSKISTVPADPTRGVADSLALAHCRMPALDEVLHGSTIAINTVLERKGARTALITTRGFRDTYAIGRGNRIEAFNLFFHRPKPLMPRELTFEVTERINASGEVLTPLDEAEVEGLGATLGAQKSRRSRYASCMPMPTRRMSGASARCCAPRIRSCSSRCRTRSCANTANTSAPRRRRINAFVGPRVQGYLRRLEGFLRTEKFAGKINIMRSNGGVMSIGTAQEQPVAMMESGPVAGMIGAGRLAALLGIERAIGFDMGGTTAKASLITNGAPAIEEGYVIGGEASGQPMQLPVVDIVEVGAGGGSIAWCDAIGGIHVGPQSAGADPGPASYGKGSLDPVVTDADLMLGRINAERFLNGAMQLDRAAAERAVEAKLAGRLRLSVPEAALGIVQIADAAMSLAVRAVSINKGVDPRAVRDDRLRRRRAAARGRHRARDLHSEGGGAKSARHFFGARHADGAVAAGFRAHALWAAWQIEQQSGRGGVRRAWRGRPRQQVARDGIGVGCHRASRSSPTCAMSARSTRSRSRCAIQNCSMGDIDELRARCSMPSTISVTARPRPTSGSRCVNMRLVVTAARDRTRWRSVAVCAVDARAAGRRRLRAT